MIPIVATKLTCGHCDSNFIIENEDGRPYCLLCGRPYKSYRDYGRIGGLQTLMRYGREHMAEIGRRGGRPRLRQLPTPEAQTQLKGGWLPNRLSELKELWKQRRGELCVVNSSPPGGQ